MRRNHRGTFLTVRGTLCKQRRFVIMGTDKLEKEIENYRRMMFEKDRLETFNKKWKELKGFQHCTPENFAAAGFYNHSSNNFPDNVKCFSCQKELSDWEKDDDPWQEHMKRGSKCPFVIFRSKENTTVHDFLQLHYETKKILLNNYFDKQKETLQEKEKSLIKTLNTLQKSRK